MEIRRKKRVLPTVQTPPLSGLEKDLCSLTEDEKAKIMDVLERDTRLQANYTLHVNRLKSELSWLRRKGAIKAGLQPDTMTRSCGRCQVELGLLLNRGAVCPSCGQRVCKQCREDISAAGDWVCLVCRKQIEIRLATGEWMNEFIRRPSRRKEKGVETPAQSIKKTLLKRSWTISGASTSEYETGRRYDPLRQQIPKKPPRRLMPTDENQPPWEYKSASDKPSRRYSMSSYDALPPQGRYSRNSSPSSTSPVGRHYEQQEQHRQSTERPKYYFFGAEPQLENIRPSTLPRKPRLRELKHSSSDEVPDSTRFHSIPRNRPKSGGSQRGRSEPARRSHTKSSSPLRENYAIGRFVSSGPVTSTPIVTDNIPRGPPYPRSPRTTLRRAEQLRNSRPSYSDSEHRIGRIPSESSCDIRIGKSQREDEGGGGRMEKWRSNREITRSHPYPMDSGMSSSSRCVSPETGDEKVIVYKRIQNKNRIPRSNTSISSGAATTGRQKKAPSRYTAVRRTRSFQAHPSPPISTEEATSSKGHVAKFVQELERGIQLTVANYTMPKKGATSSAPNDFLINSPSTTVKNPSVDDGIYPKNIEDRFDLKVADEEKPPSQNSDHSDIVPLDSNKILPEGDDYKLVFISSDSSKESEMNSSIDSDNPATPPRRSEEGYSDAETTEFLDSDLDECRPVCAKRGNKRAKVEKRNLVDAAVMTEDYYISDDVSELSEDASLSLSLQIPSPSNDTQKVVEEMPDVKPFSAFSHPLNTLGPKELQLMFQQTETVQAEAQALQKALMGAFEPYGSNNKRMKSDTKPVTKKSIKDGVRNSDCITVGSTTETPTEIIQGGKQLPKMFTDLKKESHSTQYNIYENIDISKCQPKCKTISTQTDLDSWNESDSFESDDYSDISCDSLQDQNKSLINNMAPKDRHLILDDENEEKNEEFPAPPFYLNIPQPPPPSHIQSPTNHLRLTLNPGSSVSRLSDGEVGCRSARLGEFKSGVLTRDESQQHGTKVRDNSDSVTSKCHLKKSIIHEQSTPLIPIKNERINGGSQDILSDDSSHLTNKTSPLRASLPPTLSTSFLDKKEYLKLRRMNSPEVKIQKHKEGGDINASQKVISTQDSPNCPSFNTDPDDDNSSSSVSGEDTDEDVHVSRSYDVTKDAIHESDVGDNAAEEAEKDSSVSESDTDEEKHVTGEYSVTNLLSSESENEMGASGSVVKKGNNEAFFVENKVNINKKKSFKNAKEELPECDQALSDSSTLQNSDDNYDKSVSSNAHSDATITSDKSDISSSYNPRESVTKSESVINNFDNSVELNTENKSETESNIGVGNDSAENINELISEHCKDTFSEMEDTNPIIEPESAASERLSKENEANASDDKADTITDKLAIDKKDVSSDYLLQDIIEEKQTTNNDKFSHEEDNALSVTEEKQEANINNNSDFEIEKISTEKEHNTHRSGLPENNCEECIAPDIITTGSKEVEQEKSRSFEAPVLFENLTEKDISASENNKDYQVFSETSVQSDIVDTIKYENNIEEASVTNQLSSESGQSSGGESEGEIGDYDNVEKGRITDKENLEETTPFLKFTNTENKRTLTEQICTKSGSSPQVPLRKAKRSSSSDGLSSSSSDIERSDVDVSDSTDVIIESGNLRSLKKKIIFSDIDEDCNRESDGPSSADSLLQGTESEFQCSDGSEEGNLISIVAVGEDANPRKSSQGKIYIRSDSTDSDVQIKPTCIVVTGSSEIESEEDGESEDESQRKLKNNGNDVTILEVTSDHRKKHIMSVRVTSPESSRNASPTRSKVSELQSLILATRETQEQIRSPPADVKETTGLANYFTVTLGTASPHPPRRTNKTPEILRRKLPDRGETNNSPLLNSVLTTTTPSPTLTPSPAHSPSPTLTPIPDHSEGDLLAYEENHGYNSQEGDVEESVFVLDDDTDYNEYCRQEDFDGNSDSIEDTECLGENYSETSSDDNFEREEDIRGYAKRVVPYDFHLHTIMEESCEESDYEKKTQEVEPVQKNPSELEKYYYFSLGNGPPPDSKKYANEESEFSDTSETSSSIMSEGIEFDSNYERDISLPDNLAPELLENYFTGLYLDRQPSIRSVGEDSEIHTDESGSVGSDSEGSPSPEQPRKKLFRSRGVRSVSSSRSHGYSSDKGEGVSDGSHHSGEGDENDKTLVSGEDEISTESEEIAFEKSDGQFDTIKRRKKKKMLSESDKKCESDKNDPKYQLSGKDDDAKKNDGSPKLTQDGDSSSKQNVTETFSKVKLEDIGEIDFKKLHNSGDPFRKTGNELSIRKQQSRDSGFIGSSDDLLKDKPDDCTVPSEGREKSSESSNEEIDSKGKIENDSSNGHSNSQIIEGNGESEDKSSNDGKVSRSSTGSSADLPTYSHTKGCQNLSRKDSFSNWSSDEETNIMMSKMKLFFKNMFSNTTRDVQKGNRMKSPQMMMFEAKLTSLMKTVPGINNEQVKEIVEYLSSEETWSGDSYDSSDYTGSDLEMKSELQEQISASCQQIIKNFDQSKESDVAHSLLHKGGGSPGSRDTEFVYQNVMSSFNNMKADSDRGSIGSSSQSTSPPMLSKVMHFIGNRIFDLMHEVSTGSENGDDADSFNGGNPVTSSPRQKLFISKRHKHSDSHSPIEKNSSFESEESHTDTEQSPDSENGTPKVVRLQRGLYGHDDSLYVDGSRVMKQENKPFRSQRSLEERGVHAVNQYRVLENVSKDADVIPEVDDDKFDLREHTGISKLSKHRRPETRKARSHLSLEKIHQEDVKTTGERSESLGDLLDRVRSAGYSSSYEQLDSDSTLKASDSLDRHIGSSSSNIRLNASSRGSLTTSSRGSLATSSRGSLNASSRGSLQGSSGPEEDDDKKVKKLSFFKYSRRSSAPDNSKGSPSQEMRSTTLPRSTPAQILPTGTLPRSQPPQSQSSEPQSNSLLSFSSTSPTDKHLFSPLTTTGPRSARYHAPGYRPPPSSFLPKRTISAPTLKKESALHSADESGASYDDGVGPSVSASSTSYGSLAKGILPPQAGSRRPPRIGTVTSNDSSRAASPLAESLKGSLGKTSGNGSAGGSLASFDNSPDEDDTRIVEGSDGRRNTSSLSALGPKSRSESLASVCSTGADGRYGAVSVMGELRVALQYNYKEGQLECHVLQCRELAPVDTKRNRSDPYVKAYLLPDKSKNGKRKTKVKRHTLNPIFEEVLKFTTTLGDLESRTLWLSVWHSDMFGRNDFLGEVLICLSDALFEDSSPKWYPLQDRVEPFEDLSYGASIIIALKFVPPDALLNLTGSGSGSKRAKKSRGALLVRVKEACGLVGTRAHSAPDPICKGILLPEKGKSSKQKTSICRKTTNPKWNHTMTFDDVTLQELVERSLELSVWDHDRFGGSEFLGGCRLNMNKGQESGSGEWLDASGLEVKLWNQMLERPNLWVESSVLLRSSMDKPIYSSNFTE